MIHLHNHSHYSALDGLMKIDEMIERAKEIGASAIAITDHASISGLPEFYKKCKAAEIKPIIGCEFYCVETSDDLDKPKAKRLHVNVLAKNWRGVESIMRLLTLANNQFYKRPLLTLEQALGFADCFVSFACCLGPLSLPNWEEHYLAFRASYKDDFYLEVMPHKIIIDGEDVQRLVNERAIECHRRDGVRLVVTNDAHFARHEDHTAHEVLLAIQTGRRWSDPNRWKMDDCFYLRSTQEMVDAFGALPYFAGNEDVLKKAFDGCRDIADLCNAEMPEFPVTLPTPYAANEEDVIMGKIMHGWSHLVSPVIPADEQARYKDRLVYELKVIKEKKFVRYFLIVEDVIRWSRENGIMVGPARGSSCGSLVCYLLGITQIDPLKWGLYFERFLNPERIDYPDVDVDFQDDRRHEVFEYLASKYGAEMTAQISTFGYLGPKSAFRDVCRVFDVPLNKVNELSKLIEAGVIKAGGSVVETYTEEEAFDHVQELIEFAKEHPHIVEITRRLNGVIRQMGIHAAGVIVNETPLSERAAVVARNDSKAVCWDKHTCESPFGLIKMDVLGLSTLSVLSHAASLVKERHGVSIDFTSIPMDDENVGEQFRQANTVGIFQFESRSAMHWLRQIQAKTFREVTDVTALNRPGSLESGETARYAAISRGDEYEYYACPELKSVLSDTKGILVYQEQMMRIFVEMGGFTFAEADKMRKIVGKKLGADEFNKHRKHFVDGAAAKGIDERVATETFDKMVSFANYSFNLSHAIAYTHLSWWSMWFKLYYPQEYMCALLSKTTKDSNIPAYIKECSRMGIPVVMPDINRSGASDFVIDSGDIVAPFTSIKGVGDAAGRAILEARSSGVFLSAKDFHDRVNKRSCNAKSMGLLFKANAFHSLGEYEVDEKLRDRNLKELLAIFETLPSLDINESRPAVDKDLLVGLLSECSDCAAKRSGASMAPIAHYRPQVMIINNATKTEAANLASKGTKLIVSKLGEIGITPGKIYYTNPLKCQWGTFMSAPKECQTDCLRFLDQEIRIVSPKLIICCASNIMRFLGADSAKAADMHGKVIYNADYGAYILFTCSPQYAAYDSDQMAKFDEAIGIVKEMFQL